MIYRILQIFRNENRLQISYKLKLPAVEPTGNESQETGMRSTGSGTGSAKSRDQALMITRHKERM